MTDIRKEYLPTRIEHRIDAQILLRQAAALEKCFQLLFQGSHRFRQLRSARLGQFAELRRSALRMFAVRSLTIRAPVMPITEAEYVTARTLMETLDRNGAGFLTLVDAWRKIFRWRFWEQHGGQLPQEVQAVRAQAPEGFPVEGRDVVVEEEEALEERGGRRAGRPRPAGRRRRRRGRRRGSPPACSSLPPCRPA